MPEDMKTGWLSRRSLCITTTSSGVESLGSRGILRSHVFEADVHQTWRSALGNINPSWQSKRLLVFSSYESAYLPQFHGQTTSIVFYSIHGLQTKPSQKDRPVKPMINNFMLNSELFRFVPPNGIFLDYTDWLSRTGPAGNRHMNNTTAGRLSHGFAFQARKRPQLRISMPCSWQADLSL